MAVESTPVDVSKLRTTVSLALSPVSQFAGRKTEDRSHEKNDHSPFPFSCSLHVEDMINYFDYNYPQPTDGRPFSVTTEVASCPWQPQHRLLRVGIQGKTTEAWKLAPNNLVFLLDVSGSMQPPQRLPLLKSAFRLLVDQLRVEDTVSIVVYAGAAGIVLSPTSGADKATILATLDRLQSGGSTAG